MVSTVFDHVHTISYNPLILLIGLLFVVPGHKLTHCIPLWMTGRKVPIRFERSLLIPNIQCVIRQPISKRMYLIVTALPAMLGTFLTVILTFEFPSGQDYFGALGAINFGLSLTDIIYFFKLINAPRNAYVEDDQYGCRILIKQTL